MAPDCPSLSKRSTRDLGLCAAPGRAVLELPGGLGVTCGSLRSWKNIFSDDAVRTLRILAVQEEDWRQCWDRNTPSSTEKTTA
ncbi:hypothetical protein P8C59_006758 [Phyllachora maydis]|uniref:Uncharacterized protein n=1 Tax=Phyllachora maydis TaxID=1825666 RepID=A0AAD9I7C4_9PEZI|nr:hypothetical protein P8C59_006758 [Phyllachora maydis]